MLIHINDKVKISPSDDDDPDAIRMRDRTGIVTNIKYSSFTTTVFVTVRSDRTGRLWTFRAQDLVKI
jgi:hypothetical protein